MSRTFCLPSAQSETTVPDRILLMLAAALMEAEGVRVQVCVEPAYTAVEGFVLTPGYRVVVANWLRGEQAWHVDVMADRPAVSAHADVVGYGRTRSVIASVSPAGRLRRLADHLGLDWAWLCRRAAELGAAGVDGLVAPRSRLLSAKGVEVALRFLATMRPRHPIGPGPFA
jgi:hypothetical protein